MQLKKAHCISGQRSAQRRIFDTVMQGTTSESVMERGRGEGIESEGGLLTKPRRCHKDLCPGPRVNVGMKTRVLSSTL